MPIDIVYLIALCIFRFKIFYYKKKNVLLNK